jgi:hypothetical protein
VKLISIPFIALVPERLLLHIVHVDRGGRLVLSGGCLVLGGREYLIEEIETLLREET